MIKTTIKAAVLASSLTLAALAPTAPARADDVSISINPGGIAFGYNDGYWDREHHWHNWARASDRDWYEHHEHDHYYNTRHDGDRDQGWREQDRWWDRDHRG